MSRPWKSMKQIRKILVNRLQDPLTYEQLSTMNDQSLKVHLGIETRAVQVTDQNQQLITWLEQNIHRLNQKNMTRRLLHELYRETHSDGLQYSQFCLVLKQKYQNMVSPTVKTI